MGRFWTWAFVEPIRQLHQIRILYLICCCGLTAQNSPIEAAKESPAKAGLLQEKSLCYQGVLVFLRLPAIPAPKRPRPNSARVAGSGTLVGAPVSP